MTGARNVQLQRGRPRVVLLDPSLNVAAADWTDPFVVQHLVEASGAQRTRLPDRFHTAVEAAYHALQSGEAAEVIVEPDPGTIFRVNLFSVESCAYVALFVEQRSRRADETTAAERFNLTPRESEVLSLALEGMRDNEIAERLHLSPATIADHFKNLLRKTNAKNRTDLSARVHGWTADGQRD